MWYLCFQTGLKKIFFIFYGHTKAYRFIHQNKQNKNHSFNFFLESKTTRASNFLPDLSLFMTNIYNIGKPIKNFLIYENHISQINQDNSDNFCINLVHPLFLFLFFSNPFIFSAKLLRERQIPLSSGLLSHLSLSRPHSFPKTFYTFKFFLEYLSRKSLYPYIYHRFLIKHLNDDA